eukprot:4672463-Prorocentrum_lima.AAC.1
MPYVDTLPKLPDTACQHAEVSCPNNADPQSRDGDRKRANECTAILTPLRAHCMGVTILVRQKAT